MGFVLDTLRAPSRLPKGYRPQDPRQPGRLELTVDAMARCRALLRGTDEVDFHVPPPTLPGPADAEPRGEEWLRAAREEVLCRESAEEDPIAGYKWGDNSGWLVTASECKRLARAFEDMLPEFAESYCARTPNEFSMTMRVMDTFIDYHRLAMKCGGYRVY